MTLYNTPQPEKRRLASLDAFYLRALGDSNSSQQKVSQKAVVFLHGAGANKEDLLPLGHALSALKGWNLIFFDAPLSHPIFPLQKLWFPIEEWMLEELSSSSPDLYNITANLPKEYSVSMKKLREAMDVVLSTHESVMLFGFSQGGMMAMHYVLLESIKREKCVFRGLILASTTIAHPQVIELLSKYPKILQHLPVFQSHGYEDPIISYGCGKASYDVLQTYAQSYELCSYAGGHSFTAEALQALNSWLEFRAKNIDQMNICTHNKGLTDD